MEATIALAGNQAAASVLHQKGYRGQVVVFPQFGVDETLFAPATQPGDSRPKGTPSDAKTPTSANANNLPKLLRIGYAGGLLREKGVDLLLCACAGLRGKWQLDLVGSGSAHEELVALSIELGVAQNVCFQCLKKAS